MFYYGIENKVVGIFGRAVFESGKPVGNFDGDIRYYHPG